MKHMIAFLCLSLVTQMAHADLYSDRQQRAYDQANRAAVQEMEQGFAKRQRDFLLNVQKFGKKHSGYAKTPECFLSSYVRDSGHFRVRMKKVCEQSYCVKATGIFYNLNEHRNDAMRFSIYQGGNRISYCRVVLRNGLACSISYLSLKDGFGGKCYDSRGNARDLQN
jgi:hypothetical protein